MYRALFSLLYFLIICNELYLGNQNLILGISPRVLIIPLVFVFIKRNISASSLRYIILLVMYVLAYLISVLFDPFAQLGEFLLDTLISRFVLTIAVVIFTSYVASKWLSIDRILLIIFGALFLNNIVLIAQFHRFNLVTEISYELTGDRFANINVEKGILKHLTIHGLVGTVYSGYLLVVSVPILLYKVKYSGRFRVFYFCLLLVVIYSGILLQQRSAFYLSMLSALLYLLLWSLQKSRTLLIFLFCSVPLLLFDLDIDERVVSSLSDLELGSREDIYKNGMKFISENWLTGGQAKFKQIYSVSSHNLLLNAWIRGGIMGFLVISFAVLYLFVKAIKILLRRRSKAALPFCISLILINLLIMSFSHNSGLATGELFTFLFIFLLDKVDGHNHAYLL